MPSTVPETGIGSSSGVTKISNDQRQYAPTSADKGDFNVIAWDGSAPRVTVTTLADVKPQGQPVSVLSVTDRNQPFLYDSVMGEVTSTHRDIHLAIHPILVVAPGEAPKLFSPDEESDPTHRVSHIEIHLSELAPAEAASLAERVGNRPWALRQLSLHRKRQTTRRIVRWTHLLLPLATVLMGGFVLFQAASVFESLVSILQSLL